MRTRSLALTKTALLAGLLVYASVLPATAADRPEVGGSPRERVAASFVESGREYLKAGRFEDAAKQFNAALRCDPSLARAREGLAKAEAGLRRPGGPGTAASQKGPAPAVPVSPKLIRAQASARLMCEAARRLFASRKYREAAAQYDKVLRTLGPGSKSAVVAEIRAEARQGLRLAREGILVGAPRPAAVAAPARAATKTPRTLGPGPGHKKEDVLTDDIEGAMDDAIRQVGLMMTPQTRVLTREKTRPRGLARGLLIKKKDYTTGLIGRGSFRSAEDAEAANLIKAKLLNKVSVRLEQRPFIEAIDYIRAVGDINIVVDPAIVPTLQPVTLSLNNVDLRYVLRWILRFQSLDYRIRDGAIFVSNEAGLAQAAVTMWHDISDLTIRIKDFRPDMAEGGMITPKWQLARSGYRAGRFTRNDQEILDRDRQGEEWARFVGQNVAPGSWDGEGGVAQNRIAYRSGKLVVTHSPEVQEQIRELLASFRKARAIQVAILARFIEINEDYLEELGVEWRGLGTDDLWGALDTAGTGTFQARVTGAHEVPLSVLGHQLFEGLTFETGFLRTWQVRMIITAVRKEKKGNILTAPRVTCFNTQRAFMTVSTRRNFVRSYDDNGNPEIGQVVDGIVFEVQPFVSADRRYITLELVPQVNMAGELQEFPFRRTGTGEGSDGIDNDGDGLIDEPDEGRDEEDVIQLPEVTTRQVMTTVSVPDGGTLLIGGLAQATEAEGFATIPFLGDIPLIGHLFTSRRTVRARNNLIILVTAHIIQQEED